MNRILLPVIGALSLFALTGEGGCASTFSGDELRISWMDDLGSPGFVVFDPAVGYDVSGVLAFGYIDIFGDPTPEGFLPYTFTAFAGGMAWDMNTGAEGVSFSWDTSIAEPLPGEPSFYETHFAAGQFLTTLGTRTWSEVDVVTIPEPGAEWMAAWLGICLLARRRNR